MPLASEVVPNATDWRASFAQNFVLTVLGDFAIWPSQPAFFFFVCQLACKTPLHRFRTILHTITVFVKNFNVHSLHTCTFGSYSTVQYCNVVGAVAQFTSPLNSHYPFDNLLLENCTKIGKIYTTVYCTTLRKVQTRCNDWLCRHVVHIQIQKHL